jgi:hypothetical protein
MGITGSWIYLNLQCSQASFSRMPLLSLWGVHFVRSVSWASTFFALKKLWSVISCLMVVAVLVVFPCSLVSMLLLQAMSAFGMDLICHSFELQTFQTQSNKEQI